MFLGNSHEVVERKRMIFFLHKNLVFNYGNNLWDCAAIWSYFFFGGLRQPYPKFSSKLLLFFFFISQSNFWGFFSVILSFCLMRYVKLVENSNWFLYVPQKTHTDFCHTLGFFLVVSPILMYIDGASES